MLPSLKSPTLRHLGLVLKQMPTAMPWLLLGRLLLVSLALLLASACRDSQPPKIEICIGDGFGGADCVEADGSKLYRTPSMLKNYWLTSQPDEANFASWCYQTTPAVAEKGMAEIAQLIKK